MVARKRHDNALHSSGAVLQPVDEEDHVGALDILLRICKAQATSGPYICTFRRQSLL